MPQVTNTDSQNARVIVFTVLLQIRTYKQLPVRLLNEVVAL
jgi:hypothetical protein